MHNIFSGVRCQFLTRVVSTAVKTSAHLLVACVCVMSLQSQAASPDIFAHISSQKSKSPNAVATWGVELNSQLWQLQSNDSFALNLPNSDVVQVSIERVTKFKNGDIQLRGKFAGDGSVILTLGKQLSFGSINSPKHNFSISIDNSGQASLTDVNTMPESSIDLSNDMRRPSEYGYPQAKVTSNVIGALQAKSLKLPGATRIDVLVVYASDFKDVFAVPETRINQAIGFTNSAFERSGILIDLKLVKAVEFPFLSSAGNNVFGGLGDTLSDATNGVGAFSGVHQLRDDVGADLVVVLHKNNQSFAAGLAWIGASRPRFGYSAINLSPNCCDSVFAHELGHNLGSGHERISANPNQNSACTGGFTGYACGHGKSSNNWGTIMSYLNSAAIGERFSNPTQTCKGVPCGIAKGQPNAADNRASFNITRLLVAEFRDSNNGATLPPVINLLLDE